MADHPFKDGDELTPTILNESIEDRLVVICTSGTRPTAVDQQKIYETDTNRSYTYSSSLGGWYGRTDDTWTSFTPSYTNLTVEDGSNPATHNAYYRFISGDLHVWGRTTLGGDDVTTPAISGSVAVTIPASTTVPTAAREAGVQFGWCWWYGVAGQYHTWGPITYYNSTAMGLRWMFGNTSSSSSTEPVQVNPTSSGNPFPIFNGDYVAWRYVLRV